MQNFDIVSALPILFGALVLLIVFLIILNRIFINVGAREIAIKERRYVGAKMPPGRVVALFLCQPDVRGTFHHHCVFIAVGRDRELKDFSRISQGGFSKVPNMEGQIRFPKG